MDTRFVLAAGQDPDRLVQRAARSARSRCSRRCTRARRSRSAPTTSRRCSRWRSSRRRCRPSRGSTSPARCSTSCGCGGRRRSCGPRGSSRRSARRRASTSRTSRCRPAGSHKPNTAVPQAFYNKAGGHRRGSRPRPAPASGAPRWRSRARSSTSSARCTWCARRTSRSRTAGSLMETWGARVRAVTGRRPDHPGSLGLAISDAVRDAATARRHALLARLGAQPRAAAPDGHRARGQGAARAGRGDAARRRDRLVRRRLEPRRHRAAVRARRRRAARRGRAVVVPDAHRGHASSTTSATPRA